LLRPLYVGADAVAAAESPTFLPTEHAAKSCCSAYGGGGKTVGPNHGSAQIRNVHLTSARTSKITFLRRYGPIQLTTCRPLRHPKPRGRGCGDRKRGRKRGVRKRVLKCGEKERVHKCGGRKRGLGYAIFMAGAQQNGQQIMTRGRQRILVGQYPRNPN